MGKFRIGSRRLALLAGAALTTIGAVPAAAQSQSASTLPQPAGQPPALTGVAPQAGNVPAGPASATAIEGSPQTNNSPEIIVTAQRREQKLSRVPISIAAFDAKTLQSKAIVSEQDLGTLVPGLQVKNGQTSNQLSFSLRGQTLDPFSGTSPAVLTYLNEAPYTPYNTATDFFDLGSVQVLKGPQGTLFGRNATGGAVLYTTPKPGNQFDGYLIARGGERNLEQVQGAVDLPIVKDLLSVRVAGDYTHQDGYIHNDFTGNTLGDKDDKSGRITVLFTPTSKLKNTLVAQVSQFRGTEGSGNLYDYYTNPTATGQQSINNGITSRVNTNGTPLTSTLDTVYNVYSSLLFNKAGNNIGDSNLTPGPAYGPGRFPGGVAGYAAFSRANPYDVFIQYDLPHRADLAFISNTTEYNVSDALNLKNIFSYTNSHTHLAGNLAGGPFGALFLYNDPNNATGLSGTGGPGGQVFKANTISDEVQAQGNLLDNRLHYTVGGFYSDFTHFDVIPIFVGSDIDPNAGAAAAFGLPADIDYTYTSEDKSKAVYLQFDYKVTDKFSVTAGGRYTWESVSLVQNTGSIFALTGVQPLGQYQKRDLDGISWTFNFQYQIDPENMVYFAQRGSFRAGNFNGTVIPLNNANFFRNEYAHDFELGYKFSGRVFNDPFRFNAAVYDEIVDNAQHAVYAVVNGAPAGFTLNVPQSTTFGVELDSTFSPTRWLNFTATAAYTDAEYNQGVVDVSRLTGTTGSTIDFDSYPDSPRFSGTFGADLTLPVSEQYGDVILHGEVYHQTGTYFSSNEGSITPGTRLPAYTTLNMRLSWNNIMRSKISAAIFAKNLTNELYYASGYALGAAGGYNTGFPGEPRTIAGEVSVKF